MKDSLGNKVYGCIYKITNIQNNKSYIGKTTQEDYMKYIEDHFKNAMNNEGLTKYFYNAIRKYGKENFKWEILGFCNSRKKLNESEISCIYHFRTFGSDGENFDKLYGYNMTKGGDGIGKGFIPSHKGKNKNNCERLKKLSNSLLKHEVTEISREKISKKRKKKKLKWIYNFLLNKEKCISIIEENLDDYLNNGWKLGRKDNEAYHKFPWNAGETKETNKSLCKMSNSLKGHPSLIENGKKLAKLNKGAGHPSAKKYMVINSYGDSFIICGESEKFFKFYNLSYHMMKKVLNNELVHYKGWEIYEIDKKTNSFI